MKIKFTVHGEPKGKGRPRFARAGAYTRTYTPSATVEYENLVRLEYQSQCGNRRFGDDDMLKLSIDAYFAIPKSVSKKRRTAMIEGQLRPTKKPDADNIIKIIADSLNGIAYRDDAQITDAKIRKWYSDEPRVEVVILNNRKESEKL